MKSLCNTLLLAVMLISITPVASEVEAGPVEAVGGDVDVMVGQVVDQYLSGCHLVLMTTSIYSSVFYRIIRHTSRGVESGVVVGTQTLLSHDPLARDHLLQSLWGDPRSTCWAIVLHLTSVHNTSSEALRLLESSGLWKRPLVRVVVVGSQARAKSVLLHRSLRNTVHAIYIVLDKPTSQATLPRPYSRLRKGGATHVMSDSVRVYRRCLYCSNGQPDVYHILQVNLTSGLQYIHQLFYEETQNFMGHRLQGVAVRFYPYTDFKRDRQERGTTVTLRDSVDTRLLAAFSSALNFTFEIREDPDVTWGKEKDGKFNGMVGQLQREEKDFSTSTAPQPHRLKVIDHARAYPSDLMTVISQKPSLLPQHLAFIRPFTEELWLALLVSVMVWGTILWLLQRTWWWMTGGRKVRFSTSLLYGWGALLEQPCTDPSVNISAQVLLGWWLVFCLVIGTGFRSSLIADLTVQEKSRPPETLVDLLEKSDWDWGTESSLYKGSVVEYFVKNEDPVVKEIVNSMEVLDPKEALQKVLAGGYSLIAFKYVISEVIAVHFTDSRGQTPFYISNKGFYVLPVLGWGFRKGAPYTSRFNQQMLWMEASGLTSYWTDDVIATLERMTRQAAALDPQIVLGHPAQEGQTEVVLGLNHLQGAFYLLLLGSSVAFLILLAERHVRPRSSP